MKSGRLCTAIGIIAITASTDAQGQAPMNDGRIVGVWTCVTATIDGRPLAAETAKELRLTITADRYKTERAGQVIFDSTYKADATKSPANIEMIGTEGDVKGKEALGIYKLDGDMLTMCYTMPGGSRPTAFESQPQSGVFLVVWKRAER